MPQFYLPILLFVSAGVSYMALLDRVRVRLESRHPQVFSNLPQPNVRALSRFIWRRQDKALNDPGLTRHITMLLTLNGILLVMFALSAIAFCLHAWLETGVH